MEEKMTAYETENPMDETVIENIVTAVRNYLNDFDRFVLPEFYSYFLNELPWGRTEVELSPVSSATTESEKMSIPEKEIVAHDANEVKKTEPIDDSSRSFLFFSASLESAQPTLVDDDVLDDDYIVVKSENQLNN